MFCHLFLERSSFVSVRANKRRISRYEKISLKGKKKQAKEKKTKQNKRYTGTENLFTIFAISTGEHVHCSTDFRKRCVLVQLSQYNGSVFNSLFSSSSSPSS